MKNVEAQGAWAEKLAVIGESWLAQNFPPQLRPKSKARQGDLILTPKPLLHFFLINKLTIYLDIHPSLNPSRWLRRG